MKKYLNFLLLFSVFFSLSLSVEAKNSNPGTYKLVVEGFDWGPAVNKLILANGEAVKDVSATDYEVFVSRSSKQGDIPPGLQSGKRTVVFAYTSDENGQRTEGGNFVTLVLAVGPVLPIGSPIQYMRVGDRASNYWIDYDVTVIQSNTGKVWSEEIGRKMPIVDEYDLKGKFSQGSTSLTYASFTPKNVQGKSPLIIWLHGGGEGGLDPTIALLGNKAFNYASPEIQMLFGGAYVLVPQAPTFWMQAADGMTRGQTNDIYNETLFALIQDFVAKNPKIDPARIYVGGCSNGGYMSLKLIMEHPDYFAAGFISALAYSNEFISDAQVQKIKNVPMWFVHSKDDQVTKPAETVVPLFDRLKKAGAKNTHFSYYDHVTDITGFYGGDNYHYNGHWSWIYSHSNMARTDLDGSPVLLDGRPVTIMEWMAAQRKKK
jgi:poly(3-hydroxybutyrate) depolymerase